MNDTLSFAALQDAAKEGEIERVRELLDRGVDPNSDSGMPHGMSPLMLAAWKGHLEVVQLLVERGANIDYQDGDNFTPITLAAYERNWQVVDYLARNGANVVHFDARGVSALDAAKKAKQQNLLELLKNCVAAS
jgi:ankyrin repeat protein